MPKAGDLVEVTDDNGCEEFFRNGDRAYLTGFDDGDWWADFGKSGEWCVGKEGKHFKVVEG